MDDREGGTIARDELEIQPLATIGLDPAKWSHGEFVDWLTTWAERQAVAGSDDPGGDLLSRLAAPWRPRLRSSEQADGDPATFDPPALVSTREVKSTEHRYLVAAERVDEAFCLLLDGFRTTGGWTRAWMARRDATERRHAAFRRCVAGDLAVGLFRCRCCGHQQAGGAAGCNQRTCPRCAPSLRKAAQAHVLDLLDLVDRRRARAGRGPVRWRFLTLTMPSMDRFEAMRRFFGAAWGRFIRRRLWLDRVDAAVAAWETTHTAAGWHVHVHAIVDAFLPRAMVVREWALCCWAQLLSDAQNARQAWRGDALHGESIAAAKRLARAARALPLVDDGGRCVELGDALPAAMRLVHRRDLARVRAELLAMLAMMPKQEGQHTSSTDGDRKVIVRELAKYLAKDLAGATGSGDWGVAGTAARLAEFMQGSWRWRALRTYGSAFRATAELEHVSRMLCESCKQPEMTFEGVVFLTERQVEELRRKHPRPPPCNGSASQ